MVFTSGHFFFFFFLFYLCYLGAQKHLKTQNAILLAASYFFYGFWDYRFLGLILISTFVDYFAAQFIQLNKKNHHDKKAFYWLLLSILVNLSILGFFKYYNFFAGSLSELLSIFNIPVADYTLDIILPVGISFYTFQTMSYSIDVYRGRQKPAKSPLNFALFVSFFPQLMAGPIERARKLLPQIEKARTISYEGFRDGGWLILWGVFKKVYIADNLAPYTYWSIQGGGGLTSIDVYLAMIAFSFQFYCDFSGYSDMARGLAKLMGFNLRLNFNLPFLASNPAELWRRWHITLSNWFRDYVYGSLRKLHPSGLMNISALMLTMLLVGLWHGAAWTFVFWGGGWGLTLAIHRFIQPSISVFMKKFILIKHLNHWLGVLITFHIWLFWSIFFVSPSLSQALSMASIMLTDFTASASSASDAARILFYTSPLFLIQAIQYKQGHLDILKGHSNVLRLAVYASLLILLWTNGAHHLNEFIYFQF